MNPTDPAFPVHQSLEHYVAHGMDLRTYMATQFLAGLIASNFYDRYKASQVRLTAGAAQSPVDVATSIAEEYADALIARLNADANAKFSQTTNEH